MSVHFSLEFWVLSDDNLKNDHFNRLAERGSFVTVAASVGDANDVAARRPDVVLKSKAQQGRRNARSDLRPKKRRKFLKVFWKPFQ